MEHVKEAFQKVKQDMNNLNDDINSLKKDLSDTRATMIEMCNLLKRINGKNLELASKLEEISKKKTQSLNQQKDSKIISQQTDRQTNSTLPTHSSTDNSPSKTLKDQNMTISIGNEGVPTDRQTDRQTDNPTHFPLKISKKEDGNTIEEAVKILDSLDNIKKEIRLKFKRLTEQEMLVFSTLYQFEEEQGFSDYKSLSEKLNLTESSIRDYVGRLIKKGIPIEKNKINNKTIHLKIADNLKKIASLSAILQLRDL